MTNKKLVKVIKPADRMRLFTMHLPEHLHDYLSSKGNKSQYIRDLITAELNKHGGGDHE